MLRPIAAVMLIALTVLSTTVTVDARERCIRIQRQGNIETLINVCTQCVKANLLRSRPGNAVPVGREFNVQARSTFPVPFRGPGRTRVTSETPCPGEDGADKNLLQSYDQQSDEQRCVSMERSQRNGIVLVNRCGLCRAVAIERVMAGSGRSARDYMLVAGGSTIPVRAEGFAGVGLLGEIPCPDN